MQGRVSGRRPAWGKHGNFERGFGREHPGKSGAGVCRTVARVSLSRVFIPARSAISGAILVRARMARCAASVRASTAQRRNAARQNKTALAATDGGATITVRSGRSVSQGGAGKQRAFGGITNTDANDCSWPASSPPSMAAYTDDTGYPSAPLYSPYRPSPLVRPRPRAPRCSRG
jgi:hypothetical protein